MFRTSAIFLVFNENWNCQCTGVRVSGSAFSVNLTKPRVILEEGTSIGIPQIILACIHGRERLS